MIILKNKQNYTVSVATYLDYYNLDERALIFENRHLPFFINTPDTVETRTTACPSAVCLFRQKIYRLNRKKCATVGQHMPYNNYYHYLLVIIQFTNCQPLILCHLVILVKGWSTVDMWLMVVILRTLFERIG